MLAVYEFWVSIESSSLILWRPSVPIFILPDTALDNENDVTVLKICEPLIIPLLTPFNVSETELPL